MTRIRLYLDEDTMDNALLEALRLRNVDVLSTQEAQMLSRSDEAQLTWAFKNQRVIYSFNVRDFYRIHTDWVENKQLHAGIILGTHNFQLASKCAVS